MTYSIDLRWRGIVLMYVYSVDIATVATVLGVLFKSMVHKISSNRKRSEGPAKGQDLTLAQHMCANRPYYLSRATVRPKFDKKSRNKMGTRKRTTMDLINSFLSMRLQRTEDQSCVATGGLNGIHQLM
ncbi:LOW QUALITY PROTEIN: hypothetical protein PHMEG_00010876 [Phytophthora megakarya]|uniref:Uncharacterized protein n=1 Tax=Phytophthora megakarya TaxID=4795 RepID=A0A225WEA4_9STRA|nr:LOW QUALITY PROTEIN: hypothetical protein PHMEG_00010876 [Phytophthora megakarya]